MKYFMGIDNGSSSVKAGVYDETGRELAAESEEIPVSNPHPGFYERDMEQIWEANCSAIRKVLAKTGIDPKEIAAIAGCGHGKGIYLWGETGPVFPGLLSQDSRAQEYAAGWQKDGTDEFVFGRTGQHILSCTPSAILCWIRDHRPDVAGAVKYMFTCKDYIRFRLTGEACGELTECCGWGVMNADTLSYDQEVIDRLGLGAFSHAFPPIRRSSDICGYITAEAAAQTGLAEGTPVAGGLFDIGASAIAMDAVDPAHMCMIAGTWSINEYICDAPIMDGSILMNSIFYEPGRYLIEESSPTSSVNYQWFKDNVLDEAVRAVAKTDSGSDDVHTVISNWVASVPADELCPVYLPFVAGSNVNPAAEGAFVGFRSGHGMRHFARSVFEGVVFSHRYHMNKLLSHYDEGTEPEEIHLAGGATKSDVWVQMFADICGYPVRTSRIEETGTLGCAIVAAIAAGRYKNLDEAIAKMVSLSDPVYPNRELREVYDRKYRRYLDVIGCLDTFWG